MSTLALRDERKSLSTATGLNWSDPAIPVVEKAELCTKVRRQQIKDALKPKEGKRTGSFITDAARHAGVSPGILKAWLAHGQDHPNGPLGRFNRDVLKMIAEVNDNIREDIYETANGKKWEGLARIGEQFDPETWTRPGESKGANIQINIVDKLAVIKNEDGRQTATGD